jgi:alpha-glucosidase
MLQLSANRQWLKLEAAEMFWNNRDRINFQVFRHPWSIPERHPILEGEKYQLENIELNVGFDFKRAPEVRRYNIGWELRTPRTMPKRQGLKLTVDQAGPRIEEHFYGLGEKASRLDKRRGHFTMWNADTPGYNEGTDPIYQSIPFYMGWQAGEAYGIFFDNSYRTNFDFGQSTQEYAAFSAEGGEMNYYFFWGPSMKKILGRYAELTGHMPLPPMWALGNQQCRWSYYPQAVAEELVRQYREHDLPLDVLYLDIHYMQGYRLFTWDTTRYPNPRAFTDKLKQQGVRLVTIVDPGVKYQPPESAAGDKTGIPNPELAPQDKSYYVYNQGTERNYFLKRKDGKVYVGKVWPGESVYVDYTLEAAYRFRGVSLTARVGESEFVLVFQQAKEEMGR